VNGNTLLLNAAGRFSLNVDDDTIARASTAVPVAPNHDTQVKTISEIDPSDLWFFPDASSHSA
jgi:hypothetical protein